MKTHIITIIAAAVLLAAQSLPVFADPLVYKLTPAQVAAARDIAAAQAAKENPEGILFLKRTLAQEAKSKADWDATLARIKAQAAAEAKREAADESRKWVEETQRKVNAKADADYQARLQKEAEIDRLDAKIAAMQAAEDARQALVDAKRAAKQAAEDRAEELRALQNIARTLDDIAFRQRNLRR